MLLRGPGGGRERAGVCSFRAQQRIAGDLGLDAGAIGYAKSEASNGMPQCAFSTHAAGRRVLVTVNVDDGPQAYFRLLEIVDGASQIFGPTPPGFEPPQGLSGLGPFASWFPTTNQLMATNRKYLITVTVRWPGAGRDAEIGVARAAATPYLDPRDRASS